MKKSVKKISTTGLAAAFVVSAIVPVAAAETPATAVQQVIVEVEGKLVQITMSEYIELFMGGKEPTVKYITLNNGETFSKEQYVEAFMGSDMDNDVALTVLADDEEPATPNAPVAEGSVKDGEIVIGDTPEENLNETFFYNLAA